VFCCVCGVGVVCMFENVCVSVLWWCLSVIMYVCFVCV